MGAIRISKAKVKYTDNSHLYGVLVEPINFLKQGGKIWIYPEGGFNNDGTPKKTQSRRGFSSSANQGAHFADKNNWQRQGDEQNLSVFAKA